jgi:hypothetical protein
MKRIGGLVFVLSLAGAGCFTPPTRTVAEKPPVIEAARPAAPAVTADQVSEGNTAQALRALAAEIDHDAHPRPVLSAQP